MKLSRGKSKKLNNQSAISLASEGAENCRIQFRFYHLMSSSFFPKESSNILAKFEASLFLKQFLQIKWKIEIAQNFTSNRPSLKPKQVRQ